MKSIQAILISLFITFAFISCSSADEGALSISASTKANKVLEAEDPDLKLSIEELRKKYPIDWLVEKYGNWEKFCENDGYCECDLSYEECAKICNFPEKPTNLACSFLLNEKALDQFLQLDSNRNFKKSSVKTYYDGTNHKIIKKVTALTTEQILNEFSAKFLDVFNDLNEAQIKSVIVHYNNYSYEVRIRDFINIMLIQISNPNFSHKNKVRIKNFFYSEIVGSSIKLSCANLKNVDVSSDLYNVFAVNYLRQFLKPPILTSVDSAAKLCIPESKILLIKNLLNQNQ